MRETTKRYLTLMTLDKTTPGDVEREQLFYVIASVNDLWNVAKRIYNFEEHRVEENALDSIYGGTFKKMLKRALHMYNSSFEDVPTVELFWGMDDINAKIMLDSQAIYTGIFDFQSFLNE